MFNLNQIPFKTLISAEKTIGKNVFTLLQKPDKDFTDLRDIVFLNKFVADQKYTIEKASELTMEELIALTSDLTGSAAK